MKKIKCVIMDWAGTAVDYGCFAPVAAFIEAFAEKGLIIDVVQTRKPMGLPKIQHIRELLSMPEVNEQFATRYQRAWTEEDVVELNRLFEKHLFASLENYTDPIPGVIPTLEKLRAEGLKIGSTTGYTREMMNEGDTQPIGIVLCADKGDSIVKYTLPEDNHQIFASKYFTYLPTEEELKHELNLDDFYKLEE